MELLIHQIAAIRLWLMVFSRVAYFPTPLHEHAMLHNMSHIIGSELPATLFIATSSACLCPVRTVGPSQQSIKPIRLSLHGSCLQ